MASKFTTQGLSFPAQGSAEFNGTSDYIQLDNAFSHTNHTIAAWVYAEDNAASKEIFQTYDANDDGIRFLSKTDEAIRYSVNNSDADSSSTFLNEWVFAVGTYDGTTQKLYINGSLDVSKSTSQTISTTTDARIGTRSYSTPTNFFNGNLANVAFWNRALSSDEINSVMWKSVNALTSAESNGLQAWYSLDDISGTSVPDSSGNGNNGTAN